MIDQKCPDLPGQLLFANKKQRDASTGITSVNDQ